MNLVMQNVDRGSGTIVSFSLTRKAVVMRLFALCEVSSTSTLRVIDISDYQNVTVEAGKPSPVVFPVISSNLNVANIEPYFNAEGIYWIRIPAGIEVANGTCIRFVLHLLIE